VDRAGHMGILLVLVSMGFFALIFVLFNRALPSLFSTDESILSLSADLLIIAAFFQMFDGLQVVSIGILRGMEDVKFPTYITLLGYWILALPLAYFLGFTLNLQVIGIWYALSFSLVFVGIALYLRFRFLIRKGVLNNLNEGV
jgi:multidrug resistance protein, MATE family